MAESAVTGLDLANKLVLCADHPPVSFDFLSINTGSTPRGCDVPGAAIYALPVKPVDGFLEGWTRLVDTLTECPEKRFRLVMVGGGAGGVELLLSVRHRLLSQFRQHKTLANFLSFHLVTATDSVLSTHNQNVRQRCRRILTERNIGVHLAQQVIEPKADKLIFASGNSMPYDALLWATNATAPAWPRASELAVDSTGFISVNECLQCVSHPFVFAAGDIASVVNQPRPKSGVFAEWQGPPLAGNLRRALLEQPLKPFRPQRQFLSLISTGDKKAIASRRSFACEGRWVWCWKDWIDRRWMRQYQQLPLKRKRPDLPG